MTVNFQKLSDQTVLRDASLVGPAGPLPGLWRNHFKRAFDVSAVLCGGLVVLPLILCLAALVALDGHNPFYFQNRVGRHGRIFRLVKLRTMLVDADRRLAEHLRQNAVARLEWDAFQKLRNDPRITRLGRILRRYSLDELPQLFNVLRGDMALVGPRPIMTSQRAEYPGSGYYHMRPGLTGPWQVSARNETTFAARAILDNQYAESLSFLTDLRLLGLTVRAVLRGTGC